MLTLTYDVYDRKIYSRDFGGYSFLEKNGQDIGIGPYGYVSHGNKSLDSSKLPYSIRVHYGRDFTIDHVVSCMPCSEGWRRTVLNAFHGHYYPVGDPNHNKPITFLQLLCMGSGHLTDIPYKIGEDIYVGYWRLGNGTVRAIKAAFSKLGILWPLSAEQREELVLEHGYDKIYARQWWFNQSPDHLP